MPVKVSFITLQGKKVQKSLFWETFEKIKEISNSKGQTSKTAAALDNFIVSLTKALDQITAYHSLMAANFGWHRNRLHMKGFPQGQACQLNDGLVLGLSMLAGGSHLATMHTASTANARAFILRESKEFERCSVMKTPRFLVEMP